MMNMRRSIFMVLLLALVALVVAGCPEKIADSDDEQLDVDPPLALYSFGAKAMVAEVTLVWESPGEDDDDDDDEEINEDCEGILIIRGEGAFPNAIPVREEEYAVGDALGGGTLIAVLDPQVEEFVDTAVQAGHTYYYEAITFDDVPNYSGSVRLIATPGSMVWGRLSHSQTPLADGRVLLAGGLGFGGPLDRAEVFDPLTEEFEPVAEEMKNERFGHTATRLQNGEVLLVGGYESGFAQTLAKAELFDPETETFRRVSGEMELGRALHTATLLPDGRVLIVGGTDGVNALATLELYDPDTQTFELLPKELWRPRYGHQAAVSGEFVIVFGGFDGYISVAFATSVHLDDFRVASLTNINYEETPMETGALYATLTELPDGLWLVAGGFSGSIESGIEGASAELFDAAGDPFFAPTGEMVNARSGHQAAMLDDGSVLIVGGIGPDELILADAEIFDPAAGVFAETDSMRFPRTVAAISVLPDGRVLVTGGNQSLDIFQPEPAPTAEIFDPVTARFSTVGVD